MFDKKIHFSLYFNIYSRQIISNIFNYEVNMYVFLFQIYLCIIYLKLNN